MLVSQLRTAISLGLQNFTADWRAASSTARSSYLYAGLAAQRLHRPSEAIAALEAELQQFPDLPLLFEHYVRLCAELDEIDRAIRRLAANKANVRRACKQLFDQFPDPHDQSNLISKCLRSGFNHLAEPMVELLLHNSDDNVLLWQLADVLLLHQRNDEAMLIYRRLAVSPVENPLGLLHSALAEHRLGNAERAADVFEAGIQKFPEAAELIEHFALICAQLRQINRVIRFAVPDAESELQACEALFARFPDPQIQAGLIDHCLKRGLEQLAEQKIRMIREGSDAAALWQVSELCQLADVLLLHQRNDEAMLIYRRLAVSSGGKSSGTFAFSARGASAGERGTRRGRLRGRNPEIPGSSRADRTLRAHLRAAAANNRVIRFAVPDAESELQACEALFARFPDPQIRLD